MPFGAGRRMCVGFGLGRLVMFLKAVTHVHCFKWEAGSNGMPDVDTEWFGVTIVPNESEVKVTRWLPSVRVRNRGYPDP